MRGGSKLREASDRLEAGLGESRGADQRAPFRAHPAIARRRRCRSYVRDWFDHASPANIGPRWTSASRIDRIHVPALHIAGWYDTYLEGSIDGFLALRERAASAVRARASISDCRAVGAHSLGRPRRRGEFRRRGAARHRRDSAALVQSLAEGFRRICERAAHPLFRAGRESLARQRTTLPTEANYALYLHSDGRANSRKGDGELSTRRPRDEPRDIFVYDPEVPVLAPGGPQRASGPVRSGGARNGQQSARLHVREPLSEPLRVFGTAARRALCATSAAHADFTAKLVRVTPNGARSSSASASRARALAVSRNGLHGGQDSSLGIHLEPTSCRFAAGERIRLEIASSAFPLYDRNPSNGRAVAAARHPGTGGARRRFVYHNTEHPSALYLPVMRGRRMSGRPRPFPRSRFAGCQQALRHAASRCSEGISSERRTGEFVTLHRPVGLRQIDAAEIDFRAHPADAGTIQRRTA